MAKRKARKTKSPEAAQREAEGRLRVVAVAGGIPEIRVAGRAVNDFTTTEVIDLMGELGEGRGRRFRVIRSLYPMVVDRWLAEGGTGFGEPQRRAIEHCRSLWHRAGSCGRLVANYEGVGGGSDGDGHSQHEALAQLGHYRDEFLSYWDIFENVCRHNLPAGTAGSDLANNPSQAIASAKTVVGFIASKIAEAHRF